jgi:hypothetical protein
MRLAERKDEKRDVGLGPEHDWSSYAADAFGSMAIAYEDPSRLAAFGLIGCVLDNAINSSKVIKSQVFVDFVHGRLPQKPLHVTQRISGHFGSSARRCELALRGRKRWHPCHHFFGDPTAAERMTRAVMRDVELIKFIVEPAAHSPISSYVHQERMRRLNKEPAQPKRAFTFMRD